MAYVARQTDFQDKIALFRPASAVPSQPRRGLLRRFFDSIMEGRQRRVQREIDRFVAWHGRNITDSLEREIGSRMFTGDWNLRR